MNVPLSVTVQSLVAAMLAKSGLRSQFHLMIEVGLGKLEQAISAACDYVLLLDVSGSMSGIVGERSKLDALKAACEKVINRFNPDDRVSIIAFDEQPTTMMTLANCNNRGKTETINTVYGLGLGGATCFASALLAAKQLLHDSSPKRAGLFFPPRRKT